MPVNITTKYPASVDLPTDLLVAVNNWRVPLAQDISASATSLPLQSTAGLQPAHGVVSIGGEVIGYEYIDGNQLENCARGFDGTTASNHYAGTMVELRWVAQHHNLLSLAVRTIQGVLGPNPLDGYNTIAQRLERTLPTNVAFPNPTTEWNFQHDKRRLADIQLWRMTGTDTYEKFNAAIKQEVNTGGPSQVTIDLAVATAGFAVVS